MLLRLLEQLAEQILAQRRAHGEVDVIGRAGNAQRRLDRILCPGDALANRVLLRHDQAVVVALFRAVVGLDLKRPVVRRLNLRVDHRRGQSLPHAAGNELHDLAQVFGLFLFLRARLHPVVLLRVQAVDARRIRSHLLVSSPFISSR